MSRCFKITVVGVFIVIEIACIANVRASKFDIITISRAIGSAVVFYLSRLPLGVLVLFFFKNACSLVCFLSVTFREKQRPLPCNRRLKSETEPRLIRKCVPYVWQPERRA